MFTASPLHIHNFKDITEHYINKEIPKDHLISVECCKISDTPQTALSEEHEDVQFSKAFCSTLLLQFKHFGDPHLQ